MTSAKNRAHSSHKTFRKASHKAWLIPLLCLFFGGALLGLSTNLAKLAGELALAPMAFLTWSVSGAAIILFAIALIRRALPPINSRCIEYYGVAALVGVAGSNFIFFSAVPHVGAGFVALIISLPPLLTYVGALALGMERFNMLRALGVAAALGGAAVLAISKLGTTNADNFWIVLALLGPVLLAIGNIYRTLRWPPGVTAAALAPGMLIAAALMLIITGLITDLPLQLPQDKSFPLALIFAQALVFSGQFLLLFTLQKNGGPVLLSLLGAVGAIVGVPVAVLLQGEAPPEGLLLGALLIGGGVALVTLGRAKASPEPVGK